MQKPIGAAIQGLKIISVFSVMHKVLYLGHTFLCWCLALQSKVKNVFHLLSFFWFNQVHAALYLGRTSSSGFDIAQEVCCIRTLFLTVCKTLADMQRMLNKQGWIFVGAHSSALMDNQLLFLNLWHCFNVGSGSY